MAEITPPAQVPSRLSGPNPMLERATELYGEDVVRRWSGIHGAPGEDGVDPQEWVQLGLGFLRDNDIDPGEGIYELRDMAVSPSGGREPVSDLAAEFDLDESVPAPPPPPVPSATPEGAIGFDDVTVPDPVSPEDERFAEREAAMARLQDFGEQLRDNDGNVLETVFERYLLGSFEAEWSVAQAMANSSRFEPDPNFSITPEVWEEATEGIPLEYQEFLHGATSEEHLRFLAARTREDMANEARLSEMGLAGLPIRMTAALLDPVAIGAAVASEGMLAPLLIARKFNRFRRVVATALAAGAENAAVEALLVSQRPTGNNWDIAWAGLAGFGLGGGIAMARNRQRLMLETALTQASIRGQEEVARAAAGQSSVGAAQVGASNRPVNTAADEELRRAIAEDGPQARSFGRYDALASVGSSPSPLARETGYMIFEDASLPRGEGVAEAAASETQVMTFREFEARFNREVATPYNQWVREQRVPLWQRVSGRARRNYMTEVTNLVRDPLRQPLSPHHAASAAAYRQLMVDYLYLAQNPGYRHGVAAEPVGGFEKVMEDFSYITRFHDYDAWRAMEGHVGSSGLERLIQASFQALNREVSEEAAARYARMYVKRVREVSLGLDLGTTRGLAGDDLESLRMMLQDEAKLDGSAMDDATINEIISEVQRRHESGHPRSRKRFTIDENFGMELPRRDGNGTQFVRISDLLVNDAEAIFQRYNRQMSGAIGMARVGFRSAAEFETRLDHIRATRGEVHARTGNYSQERMETDIKNLEYGATMVYGRPIGRTGSAYMQTGPMADFLRFVRDYNFIRLMGQVGFAQLAEIGNALTQHGFRAAMSGMPGLRSFVRDARTGELQGELARDLEAIFGGIGSEMYRGTYVAARHDMHDPFETFGGSSRFFQGTLNVLEKAKRFTSIASGMAPINTVLHRWAGQVILQRVASDAFKLTKVNAKRMRDAGWSDEQMRAIHEQLRKHSTLGKGTFTGKKLRALNLDRWDDPVALQSLREGVFRLSRRVIQENDPSNTHRWFQTPLGKIIGQFRSFMLVSYAKQLARGVHLRDWEAFASFMLSTVFGGLAYVAQTSINSVGREDAEAYLNDRLSMENIAKAAFQRAAFSSVIPMMVDSGTLAAGMDPVFNFRSSGQSSDPIFGNPTVGLLNDSLRAIGGMVRAPLDSSYSYSEQDFRRATSSLPWQNLSVIRNGLSAIGDLFPEYSDE